MPQKRQHRKRPSRKSPFSLIIRIWKIVITVIILIPILINVYMVLSTISNMANAQELTNADAEYIVVLGAGIEPDGSPSPILKERLDTAIALYENNAAPTIIVSGGTDAAQSEVSAMRNYLIAADIPARVIDSDTHGFDTYASVNNLQNIYDAKSVILVSQRYHLYRAVFIAEQLGLDVFGCPASESGISDTDLLIREFFARVKDFSQSALPAPLAHLAESAFQESGTTS